MFRNFCRYWLPRWLLRISLTIAGILFLSVAAAPWVDRSEASTEVWFRLVALFARDTVVRKTAIASALGLAATGWIFFRPLAPVQSPPLPRRKHTKQPPPTIVGA